MADHIALFEGRFSHDGLCHYISKLHPEGKMNKFTLIGGANSMCCEVQAKLTLIRSLREI